MLIITRIKEKKLFFITFQSITCPCLFFFPLASVIHNSVLSSSVVMLMTSLSIGLLILWLPIYVDYNWNKWKKKLFFYSCSIYYASMSFLFPLASIIYNSVLSSSVVMLMTSSSICLLILQLLIYVDYKKKGS